MNDEDFVKFLDGRWEEIENESIIKSIKEFDEATGRSVESIVKGIEVISQGMPCPYQKKDENGRDYCCIDKSFLEASNIECDYRRDEEIVEIVELKNNKKLELLRFLGKYKLLLEDGEEIGADTTEIKKIIEEVESIITIGNYFTLYKTCTYVPWGGMKDEL